MRYRNAVGVKGLVRPAARRARTRPLDAHGMTPASGSGCRGRFSPCTPSPRRQEWGVQRGKAPLGKGRRPAASYKKSLPGGQALPKAEGRAFLGKASPRAEALLRYRRGGILSRCF